MNQADEFNFNYKDPYLSSRYNARIGSVELTCSCGKKETRNIRITNMRCIDCKARIKREAALRNLHKKLE